jgi:autoinducer 2-degrading protein
MEFEADKVPQFLTLFEKVKATIANFEGCTHVEVWQQANNPCVLFTYSHWENQNALDNYRHSDFFQRTWKITKALFTAKPIAWSVNKIATS